MSNYIVVRNGLLRREKPITLPIVEFRNKPFELKETIENGKLGKHERFFGVATSTYNEQDEVWDRTRARDIEDISGIRFIRSDGSYQDIEIPDISGGVTEIMPITYLPEVSITEEWVPPTTLESIIFLYSSVEQIRPIVFGTPGEILDNSPRARYERGEIDAVQYLDIISEEDN